MNSISNYGVRVFFAFILVIWRTHIKYKTRFNICMYFITHKFNKKKTTEIYLNAVDLKTIQPIMKMKCEKKVKLELHCVNCDWHWKKIWLHSHILWPVTNHILIFNPPVFHWKKKEFYFLNLLIKKNWILIEIPWCKQKLEIAEYSNNLLAISNLFFFSFAEVPIDDELNVTVKILTHNWYN